MKKRQEKREAQRRRQQAQHRQMRLRLLGAVLILAFCGGGIWFLTRNAGIWGVSASQNAAVDPVIPVATVPPTEPPKSNNPLFQDPITTIHIKAAGDLNITDAVIDAGVAASGFDFSRAFQDVAAILADADLTVMNFEGNICGEPYGTATTSAPPRILQDLRMAGVDLIQMANSSVINNGLIGLTSTLNAIRDAGMEPLGAYASAQEFKSSKGYTISEVKGIKVAFVAFTKGLGGRGLPAGQEDLVNLLYTDYADTYQEIDEERIAKIMKNVSAEKPDLVVAMLHWGSEYNDDISRSQEKIVTMLQKQGVDIILGTHPHLLQPIVYDQKEGTLVAYSLGDFFGDAERGATNYSIILDVEVTKDSSTGQTKVTGYSYTPIFTVRQGEVYGYQAGERRVVRIRQALRAEELNYLDKITGTTKDAMNKALKRVEERLDYEQFMKDNKKK